MPNRFCLATPKDRGNETADIVRVLEAHGWERTFAWVPQNEFSREQFAATAVAELAGVERADVLVPFLPAGFGTHVEIGAALATGKRVVLHAPDEEILQTPYPCVFHYHPKVTILISETIDIHRLLAAMSQCASESTSGTNGQ